MSPAEKTKLINALRELMGAEAAVRNLDTRLKTSIPEQVTRIKTLQQEKKELEKEGLPAADPATQVTVAKEMQKLSKLVSPAKGTFKEIWSSSEEKKMDKAEAKEFKKKIEGKTAKLQPVVKQAAETHKSLKTVLGKEKGFPFQTAVVGYCEDLASAMDKYKAAISKV